MRRPFPALPLVATGYAGGVITGAILGGPWLLTAILSSMLALVAVLRGDGRWWLLVAFVAITAWGHGRIAEVDARPPPPLASMAGEHEVVGAARDDAVVQGSQQRVDLDVEAVDGAPVTGAIRLRMRVEQGIVQAGDRLRLEADLEVPPPLEAFDYAAYLRDRDIYLVASFPRSWERIGQVDLGWRGTLHALHRGVVERIERTLPEPSAAIAAGVLVGERGSLPEDVQEALRATGTTHLVVVSGQNVSLLLAILIALLTAVVSRRIAAVIAVLVLPSYVVFVGADPPVVRAGIMAVAVIAATVTGRRTPSWLYLLYAVSLMLAADPRYVRDTAFQLSATATAGITMLAPVLRDAVLARAPALQTPARSALVTVSATATGAALAVLPVQVAAFSVVAPWTVLANIVVAPLYEATVAVAALAALLGGGGPAGPVLALVPSTFLAVVEVLAALPFAQVPVTLPLVAGVAFAGALVMLTAWLSTSTAPASALEPSGGTGIATTAGLAVVAVGLWWTALTPGEVHPSVTVLDVGQGLGVLVRDRDATLLIDTGPHDGAVVGALGRAGVSDVDAVVLTHADVDHAGGLDEVRRRFDVEATYVEASMVAEEPDTLPLDIGDRITVGRALVEVIAPPFATRDVRLASENDGSLVLMVSIGERRVLVTGDIEAVAEQWLLDAGTSLRADVLVVPHHGSNSSSTPAFIEAVAPSVAVVPVGTTPYGHPHPDVLARYAASGAIDVYRTDEDGSVTLRSDGTRLWLDAEHER